MSDERGSRFDDAIDRAVREMLDVEPRADLRARVIARVSGADERTARAGKKLLWVAVPLAAAATLVVALSLPSRTVEPQAQPQTTAVRNVPGRTATPVQGASAAPASVPLVTTPAPARTGRAAPVVAPASRPRAFPRTQGTVMAASAAPEMTTDIEPLKSIAPIELAPLPDRSIAPADIAINPLNTITALHVAPLTPPTRRN